MKKKLNVYHAKTLSGAQTMVRMLLKQRDERHALLENYAHKLTLLARLAADGPAFDNPLTIYDAKVIRDEILRRMNMGPDGKYLTK